MMVAGGVAPRLLKAYFPLLVDEPEELRQRAAAAQRWQAAFEARGADWLRTALSTGRCPLGLEELKAIRPEGELLAQLRKAPQRLLSEAGLGLHLAALRGNPAAEEHASGRVELELSLKDCIPLTAICADLIGAYVAVRGRVVRASAVSCLLTTCAFACARCGARVEKQLKDGVFEWPRECGGGCRPPRFEVKREECIAEEWQRLRLQQELSELPAERRAPAMLDCDLRRQLVRGCNPGDSVVLSGIVRCSDGGGSGNSAQRAMYVLHLDVKAVANMRRPSEALREEESFSELQLDFLREAFGRRVGLPLLAASFCPHIYGRHLVKAALLLSLLGGVASYSPGHERKLRRRGDVHALLLGDPGLGKSELLRALARLSGRGFYSAGNSTSTAGLTAAVVRDAAGEFALEAGALVLADTGLCCIDEFDKMGVDQHVLLEAMEQQTVSIAKAGIVCTLQARTTVVAAANPAKGQWDMRLTTAENMKGVVTEALLSRFDVTFLMRDDRSAGEDAAMGRHITARRFHGQLAAPPEAREDWAASAREAAPFAERIARAAQNTEDLIPAPLLSAYLRYARCFVQPSTLTKQARQRIKEYWKERRRADHAANGEAPVTPRLLEALMRLSQARARAELRSVVLSEDVEDVLEILQAGSCVQEALPSAPVPKSRGRLRSASDRLRQLLQRQREKGRCEFAEAELQKWMGPDFQAACDRLNGEGLLLKRGPGLYEFRGDA